jgi:hypothetical protein
MIIKVSSLFLSMSNLILININFLDMERHMWRVWNLGLGCNKKEMG